MTHRTATTRLQLVAADETFPLTLEQVKEHLGITLQDDDTRLMLMLEAATGWAENAVRGGIALRTQTWDLVMPDFPGAQNGRARLFFPKPPLQSVTTVKYLNSSSVLTTLTEDTDYRVEKDYRRVGWIVPMPDKFWPTVRDQRDDGVQIRFIAGHSSNTLIPANIKQAMLLTIGHWNENREAVIVGTNAADVPQSATMLINQAEYGSYG